MLLDPQFLNGMLENWETILHDVFFGELKIFLANELHEERAIDGSPLVNHCKPKLIVNNVHDIKLLTGALLLLGVLE